MNKEMNNKFKIGQLVKSDWKILKGDIGIILDDMPDEHHGDYKIYWFHLKKIQYGARIKSLHSISCQLIPIHARYSN